MEGQEPCRQRRLRSLPSRLIRGAAAVALTLGVIVFGGPFVGVAAAECQLTPSGEWVCGGSDEDPGDDGGPGDNGPAPRVPHDTYQTPACMFNGPPPGGADAMCTNATAACEARGEEGILMRYYVQWEANGPWELVDTRCSGGDEPDPVTPDEVRAWLVEGWLPAANVGVSPGNGRTLIDFPTIFYTEDRDYDETRPVPNGGGQVHVIAEQAGFHWTWGDGQGNRTSTGGVPYSRTTPESRYVTHEYAHPGTFTIDVDVEWTARFQVPGGPWQDLGTVTVTRGQSAPITALEKDDVPV